MPTELPQSQLYTGLYSDPRSSDNGQREPLRVRIKTGFGVLGPSGEHLEGGSEYELPGIFARQLIDDGRAVNALTGEGRPEPAVVAPARSRRSGKMVSVRVIRGFSFVIDGEIHSSGEEFEVDATLLPVLDGRVEPLDVPKKRPAKPADFPGELHRILILGQPATGMGIQVPPLGHVEFGAEVEVPDSVARMLISAGRARSLRPEQPNPDALELAELLGVKDKAKHARVVKLASKMFNRNRGE